MDYIINKIVLLFQRFASINPACVYCAVGVLTSLLVFSLVVGFCLFKKLGFVGALGAVPIVRTVILYKSLGILSLLLLKPIIYAAIILLDVFAYTSLSMPDLYYISMIPLILALLVIHAVFSKRLSYVFDTKKSCTVGIFFLPYIILPVFAFSRSERVLHIKFMYKFQRNS